MDHEYPSQSEQELSESQSDCSGDEKSVPSQEGQLSESNAAPTFSDRSVAVPGRSLRQKTPAFATHSTIQHLLTSSIYSGPGTVS